MGLMGSYNLYKRPRCHNQYLLNDILRGEWGYDEVVCREEPTTPTRPSGRLDMG